jgi:hypothetical protein
MSTHTTDIFELSTENEAILEEVFRRAVRQALEEHERAGNPVAIWRDGRVIIVPASEALREALAGDAQTDRKP